MRRSDVELSRLLDKKVFLSDPSLISALGAHVRSRVPSADADDVVQSVLADALASDGAPSEAEALRKWVFGVARNKIADFYRRNRREQPLSFLGEETDDHAARDLLHWAEGELPPDSDAKRTFEWMLREGDGEKLESIAASEKLPAPRVRKRVSRMREHFRTRWAAYVAALAAAGIAAIIAFYILRKKPEPQARIVPEPVPTESIGVKTPPVVPSIVPSTVPSTVPSALPIPTGSTQRPRPNPTSAPPSTATVTPTRSTGTGSGSL